MIINEWMEWYKNTYTDKLCWGSNKYQGQLSNCRESAMG